MYIGLSGGIGSGKTTVTGCFVKHNIDIYDADEMARLAVAPGQPALTEIIQHFGHEIINEQGTLHRQKLRDIIFYAPEQKLWLENLLHPIIRDMMFATAKHTTSPYCLLVVPLLFESKIKYPVNRILIIDTSLELQLERTQKRDGLSRQQAQNIVDQQVSRRYRRHHADDIIENNGNLDNLKQQVEKLHAYYLKLNQN
ncbi:Dephospho-CoA kinase [Piscirickettsia salmonis]|uniref:Dephospho-CoA kinase n=1 Tax=Piscirickettsia salmonis TaxID=1238 RepID=A0A1L6TF05_PISSA|nr:dephospho-CoA kinase [Piscirickettsia salmonis]AKP72498.1 dephospho-CoA kinase [Piscirickettsia salmonis LF-89 = ATCC VR-1361]ALB24036.1 dephospho-CoA kinase [Piscirickettsia salmonis]ALY03850.1 dephospho-CoA kinase [Piscirickettsia salmonis]AMA43413.1 dephospho-CoA kinase [Piscirickettsia salmonis]AOS35882.1 dephospho-CoA kinase [Piscirickettsia salmonis]